MNEKNILFVEVRTKTLLYDAIAGCLQENGINISWIIQNQSYTPTNYTSFDKIKYPTKYNLEKNYEIPKEVIEEVRKSDRMIKNFNKNHNHYAYYWHEIEKIIMKRKPILVIGELGNFHTHLVQKFCQLNDIIFLDPETSRFPVGRFAFHLGSRYETKYGSGENDVEKYDIEKTIDSIINRTIKPDYMHKKKSLLNTLYKIYYKFFNVLITYILGERYATQSPIDFLYARILTKINITSWEQRTTTIQEIITKHSNQYLLYPLQMQPELNLDVWGREYVDQNKLIKTIIANLPSNWKLIIKPNPKSNLEMNKGLIDIIENNTEKVFAISHNVDMSELLNIIDNVITVTGTIAIERILAMKPVIILGKSEISKFGSAIKLESISNLGSVLNKDTYDKDYLQVGSHDLMKHLIKTSYKGQIAAPIDVPNILNKNNITNLCQAFKDVLSKLD